MEHNSHLQIKPKSETGIYHQITTKSANWKYLNFEARIMSKGETWEYDTQDNEMVIVLLSGNFKVESNQGNWETKNGRKDVFSGVAHTLYLSRNSQFRLTALSDTLDIGYGWCQVDEDFPAKFVTPEDTPVVIFGGDNATRQFNDLVPPGFGCSKIVVREVYTPSGNWSSFPAHKHDERLVDAEGTVLEPIQEETYFYKFQKPEAYAIQQVYTKDRSLDEIVRPRHNDVVLIPKGFHPVVAEHGFHCYYLNFLAGTDQCLANTTDPDHEWIYNSWTSKDKRLPLVTAEMNKQ
ncbi:5-deoxy-glucuronate isomerase [Arenibacter sp. ARW7G5Y1]|uniref:5-deoxy-glucuronate isomerase n=1 Tax=Arenibacter sp. ARW7G5Y1 TaxID=2135619 RepID=UPI000D7623A9|nr:5-deoxy-glucuronate isomerase [Arenibacter sp. ARW7G5Y1]PXX26037.1 5-deoxyglucuronate isomerase [Arenibacter sp. ARW7G5Y1]|tara:strand:- start:13841 stop:14716 length:876 start_codon:yes stop_codon:yes gene_type:complete